jgi:hypothetical protein
MNIISISNLLYPNEYNINCNQLTCNNLSINNLNGSFIARFAGAITAQNVTVFYTKIGPLVTLRIPSFTGAYSGTAGSISAPAQIPSNLRPPGTTLFTFACDGYNNSAEITSVCMLIVNNLGDFYIWAGWGAGHNFTGPANVGIISDVTITYSTV